MTHYEFITKVNANHDRENTDARNWLKNATRFQLQKKDVGNNQTPVRLITNRISIIESNNCSENINKGIKYILDCYPTFLTYLSKYHSESKDLKNALDINDIKSELHHILNQDFLSVLKTNSNEDIGKFIENLSSTLEKLKLKYEEQNKINEIVYSTNSEEFRQIFSSIYKINEQDLPSWEGPEDLAYLGLYRHAGQNGKTKKEKRLMNYLESKFETIFYYI